MAAAFVRLSVSSMWLNICLYFVSIYPMMERIGISSKGVQDRSCSSIPLWHIGYLKLKLLEIQLTRERLSPNPPYLLKDKPSRRNSVVINLPGVSATRGG